MTTPVELLTEQITTLTNLVKENGGLNGLQRDKLVQDFTGLIEEQRKLMLENTPVHSGEHQSDPVQRAVASYSGRYKKELYDIANHGEHKIGTWKLRGSDFFLAKKLIDKANELKAAGATFMGAEKVVPASEDLNNAVKAMTSTGVGTGDELVPTGTATEMWQDFFAASRLANDIPNQPMPSDPFDITLGFGARTWRKGSQGIATPGNDRTTVKITLTSTEQITEDNWTYNLDEDAIIAMMPALRQNLTLTGGQQMDAFILNADATATATGNINSDDGAPASDSYYLTDGQGGIRHLYLVDNTGQAASAGAAVSDTLMAALIGRMGKYGLDFTNVRIVPDVATYLTMLGLTNVATIDKFGPGATVLTGELMKYRGIPVLPSAEMPLTEADGKCSITAASNTKGQIATYNRNFWRAGFRRGLTIEVDRLIQRRVLIMVTSFRMAIAAYGTRTSAKHAAGLYNITV